MVTILGAGIALGIGIGTRYAQEPHKGMVVLTEDQARSQRMTMRQREIEVQGLRDRLDTASGELAIERAARVELEEQLKLSQAEAGRARDQLAFFEQLLPPGPEGTVDVRGAEIERSGPGLAYRVLLMRSGRAGDALFSGTLRFHAVGTLAGKRAEFDLAPMHLKEDEAGAKPGAAKPGAGGAAAKPGAAPAKSAAAPAAGSPAAGSPAADKAGPLAVQFEQYQRSQGMLEVPAGFVPESVTVSVLEGTMVRASRTVTLILSPTSPGL
nr:DUF6776 family protein [Bordetella genomosp. 13]